MSYATQQDLIDRYTADELVKVTDTTNKPPATIDATKVDRALADTDSLINSYLASRYAVPVLPVPSVLNAKACSIARYTLWRDKASERITQDYKDAIAWLGQVASGSVSLADAAAPPTEQTSGSTVKTNAPVRRFTSASLRGL